MFIEHIIRVEDKRDNKMLIKTMKQIEKEFDGEYYTRIINKNYDPKHLNLISAKKDKLLFYESREK